jgi:hypothetical protein
VPIKPRLPLDCLSNKTKILGIEETTIPDKAKTPDTSYQAITLVNWLRGKVELGSSLVSLNLSPQTDLNKLDRANLGLIITK